MASTSRGFSEPSNRIEELLHEDEKLVIVRMTRWEFRCMENGEALRLLHRGDGTYDAIGPVQ